MGIKIPGVFTRISDTKFRFTPDSELVLSSKYKFVLNHNFRSSIGVLINEKSEITFTTTDSSIVTFGEEGVTFGGDDIEFT